MSAATMERAAPGMYASSVSRLWDSTTGAIVVSGNYIYTGLYLVPSRAISRIGDSTCDATFEAAE